MRTADALARSRVEEWEELEYLLSRPRLARAGVQRLGILYRRVVSDLARARRDFPADRVADYLQSLAARAHPLVYRGRRPLLKDLGHLLSVEFPAAVRRLKGELLLSLLAFLGSALLTFVVASRHPAAYEAFLPESMKLRILSVAEAYQKDPAASWVDVGEGGRASTLIAFNNIQVVVLAFAGGALLGLLTLHVLLSNGILLGLVAAFARHEGAGVPLARFVAAHAPLELSVIVLAGAAGLSMGHAFFRPGERPRLTVAVEAARRAVTIALGGASVLLVSALIEGYLSPSALPFSLKVAAGLFSGGLLWGFLFLAPVSGSSGSRAA